MKRVSSVGEIFSLKFLEPLLYVDFFGVVKCCALGCSESEFRVILERFGHDQTQENKF